MKNNFFDINSVAIIGASETSGKIGNDLLKNIKEFSGKKYGVNPKGGSFENIIFYTSISELPTIVDIAVIAIPAKLVLSTLKECGKKGIKRVIIISAGFKEIGNMKGENQLIEIAKEYGIKLLGPNCLGYIDAHKNLNLSFGGKGIKPGNISIISQSGAIAVALTDWAGTTNLGFSKFISMGNKANVDENDILEELAADPKTEVIVIYLESIENGRKFYELSKKITKRKPIIMIKSGVSEKGKKAAISHTGALSGEVKVLESMFKDSGIHSTLSLESLFVWAEIFSKNIHNNIPEKLTIITNAGGVGVITTDHCELNDIKVQEFTQEEQIILKENMPETSSVQNPIDVIGDATSTRYSSMLKNIKKIKKIKKDSGIIIIVTPQSVTDVDVIANKISIWKKENPEYFLMTSFIGGNSVKTAKKFLKTNNILDYDFPRKGLLAYSQLLKQKKWENKPEETNAEIFKINDKIKSEIKNSIKNENTLCSISTTSKIMKAFNISFLEDIIVNNLSEVETVWNNKIESKLVGKIVSKDIPHKTDCGGVVIGISTLEEAKEAYINIIENSKKAHPNANISGVRFQEMLPSSKEIFIGMQRDNSFGEVLLVGIGGIYVNVYEDISMKLSPVNKSGIKKMFEKLKGYPILNGARGDSKIDFDSIIDVVSKIQSIFHTFPEIKEIDINPAFVNDKGSIIVDAKFYL